MEKNNYSNAGIVDENPYTSPSADLYVAPESSDSTRIREAHIKHEASIKSAGILYYVGGVIMIIVAPVMFFSMTSIPELPDQDPAIIWLLRGLGSLYLILGVGSLIAGRGLRKLRVWAKVPVGIISGLGLLNVPIGTLINGYILYLVFSKKGSFIFSEHYHQIIEQTPHVKNKTSVAAWIGLAAIIALVIIVAIASTR